MLFSWDNSIITNIFNSSYSYKNRRSKGKNNFLSGEMANILKLLKCISLEVWFTMPKNY